MGGRLDCFGEYSPQDPICRRHCALRLRCAVERDRETRYDRLEEMALLDVGIKME